MKKFIMQQNYYKYQNISNVNLKPYQEGNNKEWRSAEQLLGNQKLFYLMSLYQILMQS